MDALAKSDFLTKDGKSSSKPGVLWYPTAKTGLIGQINAENQFDIVWTSDAPIEPDPFLEGYDWWDPNAG